MPKCAPLEPLVPGRDSRELDDLDNHLVSDAFRDVAVERLGGAVQIPTQSYDDTSDIGEDARWDIIYSFADYLDKSFPLVHAKLQREKVNTHGLLFTEHIFRYRPGWDREQNGIGSIHTVDESIGVQGHVDAVRWMVGWVRNMDEAVLAG